MEESYASKQDQRGDKKISFSHPSSLGEQLVHSNSKSIGGDGIASGLSILQSSSDIKADHPNNTPPSGNLESGVAGVQSQGGSGSYSKDGPTGVDSYTPENQDDHHPLTIPTGAESSRRNAPHIRQAGRTCRWASVTCVILVFGLVVIAGAAAYVTGRRPPSIELQEFRDLILQTGAGVAGAYIWTLKTSQNLYERLAALHTASRPSSGQQLGAGLGQTYTNLSQAVAASNSLFQVPGLISEKRAEARRFQLPEGSLTLEPLRLFLRQTVHVDEDLLRLILSLGLMATLTLRQQQITTDTLHSIQSTQLFGTFEALRIRVVGLSVQETQLNTRLQEHIRVLKEKITVVDTAARKVLQDYITLTITTEKIRQSSIQDQQRLLSIKEQVASEFNWLSRATIRMLRLSEPEELADLSRNVELALGIHDWAQNVVVLLQRVALHLTHAKANIGLLEEIISTHGTVTWDRAGKDQELLEFLAQISDAVKPLDYNTAAWVQLQVAGLI